MKQNDRSSHFGQNQSSQQKLLIKIYEYVKVFSSNYKLCQLQTTEI